MFKMAQWKKKVQIILITHDASLQVKDDHNQS